jgi:hypothetical protein
MQGFRFLTWQAGKLQRTLRGGLLLLALPVLLTAPALHAADDPVATVDGLVRRWTSLEHQNDLLQANWRQDKPVLEQQLVLLEREISELAQVLEASEQEQGAVEQRRLELLQQQTQLEQEQAALDAGLQQASLGLQALQAQLPPPLVEAWSEQLPRLQDPLLNTSERLQLVLERRRLVFQMPPLLQAQRRCERPVIAEPGIVLLPWQALHLQRQQSWTEVLRGTRDLRASSHLLPTERCHP